MGFKKFSSNANSIIFLMNYLQPWHGSSTEQLVRMCAINSTNFELVDSRNQRMLDIEILRIFQ